MSYRISLRKEPVFCAGKEFQTRIQSDGRVLHQCTTCERVSRTQRRHQEPGPTTRSHDKTMGILWDSAKEEA